MQLGGFGLSLRGGDKPFKSEKVIHDELLSSLELTKQKKNAKACVLDKCKQVDTQLVDVIHEVWLI